MRNALYSSLFLFLLGTLFSSCAVNNPIDLEEPLVEDEAYLIDISEESEADLMILAEDGSYAVYDANVGSVGGIVYLNSSFASPLDDGLTIHLDEHNLPKSAIVNGRTFFFSNYTNDTFDAICYEADGSKFYFSNLKLPISLEEYQSISTRAISKETITKIGCFAQFAGMAIGVFLAVGAGSIPLGVIAGIGIVSTLVSNQLKYQVTDYLSRAATLAGIGTSTYLDIKSGLPIFNKALGWNILSGFLSEMGGYLMKKGTEYNDDYLEIFSNKEYQLSVGTSFVFRRGVSSSFRLSVTSKSKWQAEVFPNDTPWCQIKNNNAYINVSVTSYSFGNTPSRSSRSCYICVYPVFDAGGRVLPTTIMIKQESIHDVDADGIISNVDWDLESSAQTRDDRDGEYGVIPY